jgi:hypothetical protein
MLALSSVYIGKALAEPNDNIEAKTNYSVEICRHETNSRFNLLKILHKRINLTYIRFDDIDSICYNNFNKDGTEKFISITLITDSYSAKKHRTNLNSNMKNNSKFNPMKYIILIGVDRCINNIIDNISSWELYNYKISNTNLSNDVYLYSHFNHCEERSRRNNSGRSSRRTTNLIDDEVNVDDTEIYLVFPIEVESQVINFLKLFLK